MALPENWQGRSGLNASGTFGERPAAGKGTFGMHYYDGTNLYVCWQKTRSPDTFGWFLITTAPS